MSKVLWLVEWLYKLIKWIVINALPFVRGLIEEWKALKAKK